ncbi:hypothetical protein [Nostoc sp. ChiQUE01b]|uniref:hypothetical protein n=1 Tax=Nostoc sp. ChiQUE01b TaxID=3075376 RepID=UPI002AD4AD9D|nr:hypothetical protein [Nostoc sp. ChiQUE01b]MDZ8263308.1 hypothetical protein [Nostoc sp. ChiQUE01b]
MNTLSWQTMGLTIQSEFQAWTDQLLEGFIFPNDCIDEFQTLDELALNVNSIDEIESGFWELAAALTSDFLPSGEVKNLHPESPHQAVRNDTSDGSSSENLEDEKAGGGEEQSSIGGSDYGARVSRHIASGVGVSSKGEKEQENFHSQGEKLQGGSPSGQTSGVGFAPDNGNRTPFSPLASNEESLTTSEDTIHSWRSQSENFPPSNLETLSTSKIPFSQPETVTQESQFPETVKKSPKQSWITVTPVSKTLLMESTISKSQAVVSTGVEPKAHSAINSVPINRSPLSDPLPPKGLGDLANLLNLSPSQTLDWQEVKSEMRSTNFPFEYSQKKELVMRVQSDTISEPISETTIQAIAPICDLPSSEASIPPSLKAPELDLEEVLETLQRQVNQEYRRFYGG